MPTKPRIRALLLDHGSLSPLFPRKAVIGIGIALTLCGVTMTIFGAMALIVEAVVSSLCSGAWIGIAVVCSGMTALVTGSRPHNSTILIVNLFVSIFVVACSGFLTIVTLNIVIKGDPYNPRPDRDALFDSPVITINLFLTAISCAAGLLSAANFFLTMREVCQCYSIPLRIRGSRDPLHHLRVDTLQRKDRIVQWIMQQSVSVSQNPLPLVTCDPGPVACTHVSAPAVPLDVETRLKKKLRPIHSNASTSSTRLSAYDT